MRPPRKFYYQIGVFPLCRCDTNVHRAVRVLQWQGTNEKVNCQCRRPCMVEWAHVPCPLAGGQCISQHHKTSVGIKIIYVRWRSSISSPFVQRIADNLTAAEIVDNANECEEVFDRNMWSKHSGSIYAREILEFGYVWIWTWMHYIAILKSKAHCHNSACQGCLVDFSRFDQEEDGPSLDDMWYNCLPHLSVDLRHFHRFFLPL